ncbi:MAG TPA: DPP IV N-terminal domain-containing protein [Longimicrobiales bacterium]|nr:DPP IV N-terminal domain-containing protein [Longimicrobiales bacterium]
MSQSVARRVRRGALPRPVRTSHAGNPRFAAPILAWLLAITALSAAATPLAGQERAQANWPLAERFTTQALRPILFTQSVNPRWIAETDSMWYSWKDRDGTRFMLVVPRSRTRQPLFDHVRFAAELSTLHRKPFDGADLPMTTLDFDSTGRSFRFMVDSVRYHYDLRTAALSRLGVPTREELEAERAARGGSGGGGQNQEFRNFSPDSTAFAFARDHNLFVVEVATGDTVQLTTDGERWFSFGARDTAQTQQQQQQEDDEEEGGQRQARSRDPRVRANVTWSPDSRAFYVIRNDSREVGELFLVNTLADPRPSLMTYRYAMPGEEKVMQQQLFTYHRGQRELAPVPTAKWQDQRLMQVHWTTGSDRLRFIRRDRLQRNLELVEMALPSHQARVLLTESVENAYLETQPIRYLKAGNDFVWWSERTGWGHLYLYSHDGELKRAITEGPWRVQSVAEVDTVRRQVFFRGVGREAGENVYYQHMYRVAADGGAIGLLDPGNASHSSVLSPSYRFLVDNFSRVDMPGRSVLRDDRGQLLMELEATDVSLLEETGWRPPEQFMVKAADGVTDIYGVMWKPFDFDESKQYPIIAHVYPGPQTETVTTTYSPSNVNQRLAQLGFIVIQIGNRGGSPMRSNAYHSYGYYNLRDYGLADKKAGIEQLAMRHRWIDINRVGIYGHSGGGFMTAAAMMLPPYNDFFKVGVSSAGNHDNNVYNQNWSEQHHGLREVRTAREASTAQQSGNGSDTDIDPEYDIRFEIKVPANHELAENLKGRLLLVHGEMDNNVHPAGTIRLANALIEANKRFDFFLMPGRAHGYGPMQDYYNRMMMEYFAEHLIGDYYRTGAEIR